MEFAKGIKLNEKRFDNGDAIVNLTIDVTQVMDNPINNDRFINLTIKRSKKTEKLFAVVNEYYSKKQTEETVTEEPTTDEIVSFSEEELIPF